ncbi:MAG: NADH-quinone oxidoreductase subunit NuoE [Syntrophomonas sp.]|uniref:NADH-quinone oxidoreductase subunit NuoE n=1 Tax=Syntrophomonas sp. TaxID=2053627 RepID=UPI002639FD64|nr:NADH-quinone oxidoreductase subunit NuoE [Syntrophomonas sp.]MDD2511146.1 NADH-quinone oxidoreductase subunit NuoE [Syntrophomonas sp.]MDD3878778.1 NADH-quinone oxidoreductase subunit NuoE [Syntrophomonas sp.]MDD4625915.1 NADH-quinone oxidoreductase subunit NuoE [Syntrophomonas sp.]
MHFCGKKNRSEETNFFEVQLDLSALMKIIEEKRHEKGSLIAILQKAQEIYGYLPLSVLKCIARELEIKPAKVYGIATFYTQFRLQAAGKYQILLCQGTACHVNGSERIESTLCQELKIKRGETTPDGLFSLESAACLGCCSLAPVMMINGQAYGPLTAEKAVTIIRKIKAGESLSLVGGEAQ